MTSTGQTSSQEPQSVQISLSMTCTSPCSLIASTGQTSAQAPQFMQPSSIQCVPIFILLSSYDFQIIELYQISIKRQLRKLVKISNFSGLRGLGQKNPQDLSRCSAIKHMSDLELF